MTLLTGDEMQILQDKLSCTKPCEESTLSPRRTPCCSSLKGLFRRLQGIRHEFRCLFSSAPVYSELAAARGFIKHAGSRNHHTSAASRSRHSSGFADLSIGHRIG